MKISYKIEDVEVTYEDTTSRTTTKQDKDFMEFVYLKLLSIYGLKKTAEEEKKELKTNDYK